MEVVEQWVHKEVEEVVDEVGLHGRRHRHTTQTTTTTTSTSVETAVPNGVESANHQESNGEIESESANHQESNGELESVIFFDKDRGTTDSIGEFSNSKDANLDLTVSENTILQAVSSLTPSNKLTDKQIANITTSYEERTRNESITILKESRNDETDLFLDKVYKKAVAHEFYCPNCKSCIQKVIVRELESDSGPLLGQNDDTFRCTSCFSFLIPAGNWFFRNFVPNEQGRRNEQAEPNLVQVPSRDYSSVGNIHDQPKPQPSKTVLPDESSHAPSVDVASSLATGASVAGVGLISGANQTQDTGKDNVAYTKPDCGKRELESDRGVSFIGSEENLNTGNWIFRNFVWNKQERWNKQAEPNLVQDPSTNYSSAGSIQDQTKPQPNKTVVPDKSNAPSVHVASSLATAAVVAGVGLILGANQTQDTAKDNVAYPKTDSGKQEVESDRGVISIDAMGNVNTDYKLSQKREPDGRLTIQPTDEKYVKSEESDKAAVDTGLPPSTSILIPDLQDVERIPSEPRDDKKLEIIKSIVYGGLTESITSLGLVTSAASADATTLNILTLALANLVGGVFIIGHNIGELKNEQPESNSNQTNDRVDRYQELLGKRQNFILHAIVAIASFLVFGLVPPVVYGFSFRKSDNKDYKLAAVAGASLLCIIILAVFKAYIRRPPKEYIKTVTYYAVVGLMASGISYIAGQFIKQLIEKLGLFNSEAGMAVPLAEMSSGRPTAWASY